MAYVINKFYIEAKPEPRLTPRTRLTNDKMDSDAAMFRAVAGWIAEKARKDAGFTDRLDSLEAMALYWMETANYEDTPTLKQLARRFIAEVCQ